MKHISHYINELAIALAKCVVKQVPDNTFVIEERTKMLARSINWSTTYDQLQTCKNGVCLLLEPFGEESADKVKELKKLIALKENLLRINYSKPAKVAILTTSLN